MSVRVEVDRNLCLGTGVCVHMEPELFTFGGHGQAEFTGKNVAEQARPNLEETVDMCPQGALHLTQGDADV